MLHFAEECLLGEVFRILVVVSGLSSESRVGFARLLFGPLGKRAKGNLERGSNTNLIED